MRACWQLATAALHRANLSETKHEGGGDLAIRSVFHQLKARVAYPAVVPTFGGRLQ
jgi:hypothetical protein